MADTPALDTQRTPRAFLTHAAAVKCSAPSGIWAAAFRSPSTGLPSICPIKVSPCWIHSLQDVWIFLGPNSLEVGSPSQLCARPVAEKHDLWGWARASLSGSGEAIIKRPFAGWSFSTLQAGHQVAPVSSPTHGCLGKPGCEPGSLCVCITPTKVTCRCVKAGRGSSCERLAVLFLVALAICLEDQVFRWPWNPEGGKPDTAAACVGPGA